MRSIDRLPAAPPGPAPEPCLAKIKITLADGKARSIEHMSATTFWSLMAVRRPCVKRTTPKMWGARAVANITLEELEARLMGSPIEELVVAVVDDDDPWLFRQERETYQTFKEHLRVHLAVEDLECMVVGSAKYGFSLSPDTFGRSFHDNSDIDVAVFSSQLFDQMWNSMLAWRYPWHTRTWPKPERLWGVEHMQKHLAGFVDPMGIKVPIDGEPRVPVTVRDAISLWFDALKLAGNIGPARGYSVKGRLYRTRHHLQVYMAWGLRTVRIQKQEAL